MKWTICHEDPKVRNKWFITIHEILMMKLTDQCINEDAFKEKKFKSFQVAWNYLIGLKDAESSDDDCNDKKIVIKRKPKRKRQETSIFSFIRNKGRIWNNN